MFKVEVCLRGKIPEAPGRTPVKGVWGRWGGDVGGRWGCGVGCGDGDGGGGGGCGLVGGGVGIVKALVHSSSAT